MVVRKGMPFAGRKNVSLSSGNGTSVVTFRTPQDMVYEIFLQEREAVNASLDYASEQAIAAYFAAQEIQETYFAAGSTVADEVLSWIPQFDGEITAFDIEYGSLGVLGRTIVDLEIDGTTALDDELESAPAALVTETITYANASPNTATRASGSWITDGLKVGDVVSITGSANNNVTVTITVLTATVLSHTDTAWGTEEADTNDTTFTVAAIIPLVRAGAIASAAKQFLSGQEISIDIDQIAGGTAATDLSATITVKRYVGVKTSVFEMVAPFAGTIKAVVLEVGQDGSGGGATTIDVNINDTTIFTVNPTVAHDAGAGSQNGGTIDIAADDVAAGDTISIDIDAVPTNKDADEISVQIVFEPTSEEIEFSVYPTVIGDNGFTINVIGKSGLSDIDVSWMIMPAEVQA